MIKVLSISIPTSAGGELLHMPSQQEDMKSNLSKTVRFQKEKLIYKYQQDVLLPS